MSNGRDVDGATAGRAGGAMMVLEREPASQAPALYAMEPEVDGVFPADAPAMPGSKRLFDLVAASVILVVLSPLMALIALGIKLVDPGPALFRQERVGLRGRRFTCYKFRSMKMHNCPKEHQEYLARLINSDQPMTKLDHTDDPRIIPLGTLLRASGLDELPQLFNVLLGDMSLVGPRPCIPYEYDAYTDAHKLRLLATPGMTGLWQVNGKNRTTFEEMIELDIQYAFRQSVGLDLRILLRTPAVILTQLLDLTRKAPTLRTGNANTTNGEVT